MRILEGILFLLCLFIVVLLFTERLGKTVITPIISAAALLTFALHWRIEGLRWQLNPLYLLLILLMTAVILKYIGLYNLISIYEVKALRRFLKTFTIILVILSILSSFVFPVYKMPEPKGQYRVGTLTIDAVDSSRPEIYSSNTNKNRKIRIQLWYPSDDVKGYKVASWLEDGRKVSDGIADMINIPEFILSHTALVKSNSYVEAPISSGKDKFPIVIISHGWTGFRDLHTDVAEMLASNGYIVASIDHTYGAAVTVFGDGETAYLNRNALPEREKTPDFLTYANTLVNTYAGDIKFTMDELQRLNNESSILKNKLDLGEIGLLGHSTGGGACVTEGIRDSRVKAVMGLDAWVEPVKEEEIKEGLKVPSLFLRSQQWETGFNNAHLYSLIDSSTNYKQLYQINGIIHQDFTMVYMYSPISKYVGITGKLDGWKGAQIQHDFILSFFDRYIRNQSSSDIGRVAEKYKEVNKIR